MGKTLEQALLQGGHTEGPEIYKKILKEEDGREIGGSRVHFPSAPVKHLADLRNRANSQWYSSICEDQRPKIEDIERSDGEKTA